ncbi:hypothetical protein PIB30_069363 [Stylosanthes scabra]|uniref:Uncharacterized protein n=1 Tax=Stylosanthes scabra TaxID=79078 RepID=A0ABU6RN47_9FABA|nr:hypothetical protein [Stylosanthes scabra]
MQDLNSIHEEGQLEEEMHNSAHSNSKFCSFLFVEMCDFGSESKGLVAILHCAYDKVYDEKVDFKAKEKEVKTVVTQQEDSLDGMNDLHSPTHGRSRGRPRKRLGSTLEKQMASSSNKKKRKALSEVNVENSRQFD